MTFLERSPDLLDDALQISNSTHGGKLYSHNTHKKQVFTKGNGVDRLLEILSLYCIISAECQVNRK